MSKRTFVVGRRTARSTMVLVLEPLTLPILLGPWTVQAVISEN